MPFGMVSGVGRGMGVLDGGGDHQRGSFGGEPWAFDCNQWGLCCIVVGERRALPKLYWGKTCPDLVQSTICMPNCVGLDIHVL